MNPTTEQTTAHAATSTVPSFSEDAQLRRARPTAPVPEGATGPTVPPEGYVLQELADGVFWLGDGELPDHVRGHRRGRDRGGRPTHAGQQHPSRHPPGDPQADHRRGLQPPPLRPRRVDVHLPRHGAVPCPASHRGASCLPGRPAPAPSDRRLRPHIGHRRGDHSLELAYPGPNHSEGNSFIYAPHQRVLMLVDVIFPGWVPFSNLALSAFVPGVIAVHDDALAYDFEHLVSGHVTRPGTPEDVRVQLDYLHDLRRTAEQALSSVDLAATMQDVDMSNAWAVFRAYLDAVAGRTADEVVPRWKDRLGGADVFTLPNAWAMAEALRLDLNSLGPFATTP